MAYLSTQVNEETLRKGLEVPPEKLAAASQEQQLSGVGQQPAQLFDQGVALRLLREREERIVGRTL